MSDYSVTTPKGPYPTDLPEVKVGPNEETIETYGEDAIVSLDIVERLNENIIADAFERRAIVDGALCERLIRERKEAAEKIEKLRAALKPFALSEHKIERWFGMDIPDSYNVVSQWVTVGDLRAARAALEKKND